MDVHNKASEVRWRQRPEGSNWGDFGPDDQAGRMNLLTPEVRLRAAREIVHGKVFCLSLPLDLPGGNALSARRSPPQLLSGVRNGQPYYNYRMDADVPGVCDVISDDKVVLFLQYSTQWDALSHVGYLFDTKQDGQAQPTYYNGYRGESDIRLLDVAGGVGDPGQKKCHAFALGIENMAQTCVQGRGVLIDLVKHLGQTYRKVGFDDIDRIMKADGISVESGDIVCFHTGFSGMLIDMGGNPDVEKLKRHSAVLDGHDKDLLNWITESGISALVADNFAVEEFSSSVVPHSCTMLPLHEHCLFKLGVHLGELWYLRDLANWLREAGRSRFFLTAPPLRLPGAVGSPATPVATV